MNHKVNTITSPVFSSSDFRKGNPSFHNSKSMTKLGSIQENHSGVTRPTIGSHMNDTQNSKYLSKIISSKTRHETGTFKVTE